MLANYSIFRKPVKIFFAIFLQFLKTELTKIFFMYNV